MVGDVTDRCKGAIEHFRSEGYVKLKQVLSPEVLEFYGDAITQQVIRLNTQTKPMSERITYDMSARSCRS